MRRVNKGNKYNGIKAGVWYTIGNMLIKGIPFLTIPLFTRLLTTDDFGIYNTYISYENILSIAIGLGISGSIKVAKFDFKENFDRYVSSVFQLLLVVGGICLLLINTIFTLIDISNIWMSTLVLNLLVIQSIASAIYGIMGCKYVIEGQYIQNLVIAFVMTGINVGTSIFLCFFFLSGDRSTARITGTAMGTICVAMYILFLQSRKAKLKRYKAANKYALRLGMPLLPHQFSVSLLSQCDKIMIQAMVGNSEAGIYGLAVNITMVLSVIMTSIDNAWTPWFYSLLGKKDYKTLIRKNNLLIIFFMYISCVFLLIGPDIIHIMTESDYWDSIYAFIPLTIAVFLNFMYIFSVGVEYFMKKTGYISTTTLICMGTNIVLNYFMIKKFGYIAAAYATCISKLLLFILHYIRCKKLLTEKVISLKYLLGTLLIVCITGSCTALFINYLLIRYLIIAAITLTIIIISKKSGILDKFIKKSLL